MMNISGDHEFFRHSQPPVFTILIMVVTFLLGVPGNVMVLWITSVKMKWTVNTIWFWNLAVADIICCIFIPLSIAEFFYDEWVYGPALCKVVPVVILFNMFASVFTLVVISVDRCLLVVKPVWAQNHRSLKMAWIVCMVIWMLSFLMCLPAALYRKTVTEYNQTICVYRYDDMADEDTGDYLFDYSNLNYLYQYNNTDHQVDHEENNPITLTVALTRMIFGFLFPFLIILACYLRLTLKVQSSRFSMVGRKTTKVVFGIIIAFFITWAPYHVLGLITLYEHSSFVASLDNLSIALAYFNSSINPILYVFMGKDMKKKVRSSIRGLMESAFSEEVSRSTERTRSQLQMSIQD